MRPATHLWSAFLLGLLALPAAAQPVGVTFWGTWCEPCRVEFPQLIAAYRRYRDAGLEVLAVNQRDQERNTKDTLRRTPSGQCVQ